jgi:putative PIG3 family NAD(P)H quinone oxidoreductase
MKAILCNGFGDESVMYVGETAAPEMGPRDLRIAVRATAINRADLLQRQGRYAPPPGTSQILGLECAGEVLDVGADVRGWHRGDRVMSLLPGGGYAEEVVVDAGSAMHVPAALSDFEAAAFPEVFLTAFLNVFELGRANAGDTILVHGGGSGVGTAAITLGKLAGLRVVVTAGSDDKCARCVTHGADAAINYRTENYAERAQSLTSGRGVDVILDNVGATYLASDLDALAIGGRIVIIGSMGGSAVPDFDVVSRLLSKRQSLIGSMLRARPLSEKAAIVEAFMARFGEALERGEIRPVIERVFPFSDVADAHRLMKASTHFGKIGLMVRD